MRRFSAALTVVLLLLQLAQSSAGFQEVQYKGRLEPELTADQPLAGIILKAANDQDKRLLPPVADGDNVFVGVMNIRHNKHPKNLNIFVIKSIAPDIPLRDVVWGVMPFVVLMTISIVLLCLFPEIATWFSDLVMGRA